MNNRLNIFGIILLLVLFLPLILIADQGKKKASSKKSNDKIRKVCITFDNLPSERIYDKEERFEINQNILDALQKHNVTATGFVVGEFIESDGEILINWLEAGHSLGFSTFSGQDIDNVPLEIFLEDITNGKNALENILKKYKQKDSYFRFPYLHYGSTDETKIRVERFLRDYDIKIAHASIVTEDFVYNLSLEKNIHTSDSSKLYNLRDEYLTHILERFGYAEMLADELVGRPIRHILQLRCNRLNAMFLDDLLTVLEDMGYEFISLHDALKDKIYQKPDAYFGATGVSFLERLKYSDPDLLPAD